MGCKIYFCGSIRAGRQDADLYGRLIEQLNQYGTVLTEHVGAKEVEKSEIGDTEKYMHDLSLGWLRECDGEKKCTDTYIHDRDVAWLQQCDVVVAEVTQPSLGVGYEIGRALALGKQILCLYRPQEGKRLSAMILGAENGTTFRVKHYKESEAPQIFKELFAIVGV